MIPTESKKFIRRRVTAFKVKINDIANEFGFKIQKVEIRRIGKTKSRYRKLRKYKKLMVNILINSLNNWFYYSYKSGI